MKVAFVSAVVWSPGAGTSAAVLTGTIVPDSRSTFRPKPLSADSFRKPPGQSPSLPVSMLSV